VRPGRPVPDGAAAGAAAALPGPLSREHFLDAQRRHRRASWRATAIAVPAVMLAGIPLSVLVTPLVTTPFLLVGIILNALGLLPPGAYALLYQVAHILPDTWLSLFGEAVVSLELVAILLVLPGALTMLLAWLAIRLLFRSAWVGTALTRLGARPVRREVLEELQLGNIVEELAVAAAVATPGVMVIDTDHANAAAIGLRIDDSTILVSTGLLKTLDRAETQAVVAHLVGSVGNGDLRIAATLLSVFQSWGFLALLVDATFSREVRAALRSVLRSVGRALRGAAADDESRRATDLLLAGADQGHEDVMRYLDLDNVMRIHPLYAFFIHMPIMIVSSLLSITTRASVGLLTVLVFGPPMGALWSSRRRLADASAVELTRQPDALASAIARLHATDVEVPGGEPVSLLFPVWTHTTRSREDRTDIVGQVVGLQLEPEERMANLRRLGSTVAAAVPVRPRDSWRDVAMFFLWLAVAVGGLAFLAALSLGGMGLLLLFVWWIFDLLLVILPTALLALV
jgi:Zn-dependent protease with chaperone function